MGAKMTIEDLLGEIWDIVKEVVGWLLTLALSYAYLKWYRPWQERRRSKSEEWREEFVTEVQKTVASSQARLRLVLFHLSEQVERGIAFTAMMASILSILLGLSLSSHLALVVGITLAIGGAYSFVRSDTALRETGAVIHEVWRRLGDQED